MINAIFRFYSKYISPMSMPSCRYYPTCSQYSLICFKMQNPLIATYKTIIRIIRCNQLFNGGIDYPVIKIKTKNIIVGKKINVVFWLIPISNDKFFVIKGI